MLAEERRQTILKLLDLRESTSATVAELAERLRVSSMTIRRDLTWLEEAGLLRRVHGGAMALEADEAEVPFVARSQQAGHEKRTIGRLAASLIRDGERIVLDAGTTTLQVALHLGERQDLTVVTNALPVAQALAHHPGVSTFVLGGQLKKREQCTVGPPVTEALARLTVDRVFLSAMGFSLARGITDPDILEAEVKRAMIRAAHEVVLVADSSKWGVESFAQIAALAAIQTLVTDLGLPGEAVEVLRAMGVRVVQPVAEGGRACTALNS